MLILAVITYYVFGVYASSRAWGRLNGHLYGGHDFATVGDVISCVIVFWVIWPYTIFTERKWNKKVAVVFRKKAVTFRAALKEP